MIVNPSVVFGSTTPITTQSGGPRRRPHVSFREAGKPISDPTGAGTD